MNIEENRLKTFSDWPANAPVDAARIAKAGFYYSGCALEVQCFLCGVKISDWNYGDRAIVRHQLAEPGCPFVQNPSSTCNVPLIPISTNNSGLASSSTETLEEHNINERQSISSYQSKESENKYRTTSQRLQTFTNWPVTLIVSPKKLARAGFYYLQHDDEVKCAYCGGILMNWKSDDNPDKAHRENFPHCDFYVRQDEDDNLCLTNVKLMPGTISSISELGIQTHKTPKNPDYAAYRGRLRTFSGWPENLKQTPEMLASAGFYYNGYGDHVRCFHCDGGLRNWEATDDAWTEHARWFPKCEFVNLVRGQEFIKQCVNSRPPLDESIFEMPPVSPTSASSPALEITETTLGSLLESLPAIVMFCTFICLFLIKKALKKRMLQVGIPYANSFDLIKDILHDQELTRSNSSSNSMEQCNDIEANENETYSNEKEISTTFNKKSSTVDKKANVNVKETASLEEENRRLKEARLCKICMDREVAIVFLPCGHLATCIYCAPSLTYCPMCRQEILATIRTFLS
ncbi:PREDICTED: putative inhibitor of apoptosis [Habropoda laboriosa]|uniref:putative inhibitor of apoptosis n=1 Tax=Habropoda laboriosa TaxID=597456 RepID=UPI00083D20DB|nr:PREDICTED: putative inhibitor of apoptosis [Habropoda laboriosa]